MAKQVAHELRNPLTPMSLMIQNFKRKFNPNDEDIVEKVNSLSDSLIQQIEVISSISNSFSDFAKLPNRKDKLIDLVEETKNVILIFDEKINFKTSHQQINYLIDEVYFNRILTNLLKNAIQSIDDNKIVSISVNLFKNTDFIELIVEDNGSGIPEEIQSQVFFPKFTTKTSGMGLGLSMVKKIVEEYNATITFETKINVGTKFIIKFPLQSVLNVN